MKQLRDQGAQKRQELINQGTELRKTIQVGSNNRLTTELGLTMSALTKCFLDSRRESKSSRPRRPRLKLRKRCSRTSTRRPRLLPRRPKRNRTRSSKVTILTTSILNQACIVTPVLYLLAEIAKEKQKKEMEAKAKALFELLDLDKDSL